MLAWTRPLIAALLAVGFQAGTLSALTWDVPGDAPSIQAGIDSAASGDTVLVAPNTYYTPQDTILFPEGHGTAMLIMKSGVRLIGRDGAETTILDAHEEGRILFGADLDSGTLIKGFTVVNGDITENLLAASDGGGFSFYDCSLTLADCVFDGNRAYSGGGVWFDGEGEPVVLGCYFVNNYVVAESAGMAFRQGESEVMDGSVSDCVFESNIVDSTFYPSSNTGGGLCIYAGAHVVVSDCVFLENAAPQAAVGHWTGSAEVTDCQFTGNTAYLGYGGGLALKGIFTFDNCTFVDNTAELSGGAIIVLSNAAVFTDCDFTNNHAGVDGGAAQIAPFGSGEASFDNCTFDGNSAGDDGGAIGTTTNATTLRLHRCLCINNTAVDDGGALMCVGVGAVAIDSCTIAGNDAESGGGIFASGMEGSDNPYVTKSIIASNLGGGAVACDGGSDPYLACCDVWGNTGGNYGGCIDVSGINNNIGANPQFCGGGYTPYNVQSGSPCRNLANCGTIGVGAICIEDPTPKTETVKSAAEPASFLVNIPNPFNPITKIAFRLVTATEADLSIFALDGRKVKTLASGMQAAGLHEMMWNGQNERGEQVSSGTYYARLETVSGVMTRTMTLLK